MENANQPFGQAIRKRWICYAMLTTLAVVSVSLAAAPTGAPSPAAAVILETKAICREPGRLLGPKSVYGYDADGHPRTLTAVIEDDRYVGWPTILRCANGELIVGFSGDRDAHICPWGRTQLIHSADNGSTWSAPETITNTPLDDRDVGIIETARGTLLVSWFTSLAFASPTYPDAHERYARHAEKITPEVRAEWLGNWVRRSVDHGKTWQRPVRTTVSAPHGPIQLRDGRLLYVGTVERDAGRAIMAAESRDDGCTWAELAALPPPLDRADGAGLSEPHVVELRSGKLLALVRNEPRDRQCFLLQSESSDGGKTWSRLHATPLWGYPPHLLQLANGWVLVVYGHRREPFGERACVSRDEGVSWNLADEVALNVAPTPDLGYPSSVQLADGSILTVYYQSPGPGRPTQLMSTHWRLR